MPPHVTCALSNPPVASIFKCHAFIVFAILFISLSVISIAPRFTDIWHFFRIASASLLFNMPSSISPALWFTGSFLRFFNSLAISSVLYKGIISIIRYGFLFLYSSADMYLLTWNTGIPDIPCATNCSSPLSSHNNCPVLLYALTVPFVLTPAQSFRNFSSSIHDVSAGSGWINECPRHFAILYPEPSEPCTKPALPPVAITSLFVKYCFLSVSTIKPSCIPLFLLICILALTTVSSVFITVSVFSSCLSSISLTLEACPGNGYTYPSFSYGIIPYFLNNFIVSIYPNFFNASKANKLPAPLLLL